MSINGTMRTSVSGMSAQSSRLSAVAGNIANASSVGYKAIDAEFSALVLDSAGRNVVAGGVATSMRYQISQQGVLETSGSKFDLGISGGGFLIVADPAGDPVLTRAGAFVPDGEGNLVNTSGFTLLGLPISANGRGPLPANDVAGLVPINVMTSRLEAIATTRSGLSANLPADTEIVPAAALPSTNSPSATSSAKTSVVTYDTIGRERVLDIHFSRTATAGMWEVAVFEASGRASAGGFPYTSPALATSSLSFDANGQLISSGPMAVPLPGGTAISMSFEGTTQLAADFVVGIVDADGNPPSNSASIEIGSDGVVSQVYPDGSRRSLYQVLMANVNSPDRLVPRTGNVFEISAACGDLRIGVPESGGLGSIVSGALESSTVDLASELTEMIEAQRSYTANSRVFQTGAELMEVLVNLKR